MKLTTLLHSVDPLVFRKFAFKTILQMYVPMMICLLITVLLFEDIARRGGFTYAVTCTSVLFLALPFLIAHSSTKPAAILRNNRNVFSRKRLIEFDDDGMMMRFESGSYSYTKWDDIEAVQHIDDTVRIFLTKQYIHLVPDTVWPSSVERDRFLKLLRTKSLLK